MQHRSIYGKNTIGVLHYQRLKRPLLIRLNRASIADACISDIRVPLAPLPRQNGRMRTKLILLALLALALPARAASPPPVAAENGMVVSAHASPRAVGVEVLKRGGNAVDAAVAVGYALAVVFPSAGNLGGGGFMTVQLRRRPTTFIDFREVAPPPPRPRRCISTPTATSIEGPQHSTAGSPPACPAPSPASNTRASTTARSRARN